MIIKSACAGTVESSDIYVEIEPLPAGSGIELSLTSVVYEQFGKEIECTIRARVETAVCRGKGEE